MVSVEWRHKADGMEPDDFINYMNSVLVSNGESLDVWFVEMIGRHFGRTNRMHVSDNS